MSISRREFIRGGALFSFGLLLDSCINLNRGDYLNIKEDQLTDTFKYLKKEGLLDEFLINNKNSVPWQRIGQGIVSETKDGELKMVIPYQPRITYLSVVVVDANDILDSGFRLVSLKAELVDYKENNRIYGPQFGSSIQDEKILSDLPHVGHSHFPETKLSAQHFSDEYQSLSGLRFQTVFTNQGYPFLEEGEEYKVFDQNLSIINEENGSLKDWSTGIISIKEKDMVGLPIAKFLAVSVADNSVGREFNYYMI